VAKQGKCYKKKNDLLCDRGRNGGRGHQSAALSTAANLGDAARPCSTARRGAVLAHLLAARRHYPSKPITSSFPFGPAPSTDTITRVVAQHLGERSIQASSFEDRQGANGALSAPLRSRALGTVRLYTLSEAPKHPHSALPFC